MDLSSLYVLVGTFVSIYIIHWIYRWRKPKCNGVLPPGSMGLPFIGETIQLVIPSASLELPPFIKNRITRYGPIFRTSIAGRSVIVTADPEFNQLLFRQDEKLVESWSFDTFAKAFDQDTQAPRKYTRNLTLHHFGIERLREKLLPQMELMIRETLSIWATRQSVEVKSEAVTMTIDFAIRQIFGGDLTNAPQIPSVRDMYKDVVQGLMSFPINLPGTAHHKCIQSRKKVKEMMRKIVRKRLAEPEKRFGDLLDHVIHDMNTNDSFINEDFIVQLMFALLYVASDSISTTITLAFKFLAEHPLVLEELMAEHEEILKKRENSNSALTWNEYKSMTFTLQVINEVLRLANTSPGLFRRALQDIPVNGYTIPKGWAIIIATAGLHLNECKFEDPLKFNPWRWKEIEASVVSKFFMPFGSGMKQCAGADYSRVILATFLHVLVTNYRWTLVKGGKIVRAPIIRFPDGFHYKISERNS